MCAKCLCRTVDFSISLFSDPYTSDPGLISQALPLLSPLVLFWNFSGNIL